MRPRKLIYVAAGVGLLAALAPWSVPAASAQHAKIDCASAKTFCTEVLDSEQVFGNNVYVGHDEPSLLFYSNKPGSGNQMTYNLTLPADPSLELLPDRLGLALPELLEFGGREARALALHLI